MMCTHVLTFTNVVLSRMQKRFPIDGSSADAYPPMMNELGMKLTTNHATTCDDTLTVVHPSRGTPSRSGDYDLIYCVFSYFLFMTQVISVSFILSRIEAGGETSLEWGTADGFWRSAIFRRCV